MSSEKTFFATMPRGREREVLSEEEKKKRRREQKKISMRRARAKMSEADLEKRRIDDRERYKLKKSKGLIKTIKDFTPRQQRQMRKVWREKADKARQKKKNMKIALNFMQNETPPASPSFSRVNAGKMVRLRNKRKLKNERDKLKAEVKSLRTNIAKYRMRLCRTSKRLTEALSKVPKDIRPREKKLINKKTKKAIHDFLLQDEHSRLTSGKKETITRKKVKKQIRLLNDSLLNLHKAFVNKIGIDITYETFRKHRPFWVLFPKYTSRNTCLCALHTNSDFMVRALYNAKIIPFKSATELVRSVCCNGSLNINCLEEKCPNCKEKSIACNDFNDNDTILYERWVTKNVVVVIKGQSKTCRKTMKETVSTTKKALTESLSSNLPTFMKHVGNMLHQMKSIQNLKQKLCPDHGLLHIDFSENYNCKYSSEVQAAHFGGSKGQISLHTSVYYSTNEDPPINFLKTTSFCTATDNLNHDPVMVCAHLEPLVKRIREFSPNLKHLHILSDGPLTQYRNKTMFHLIAVFLNKIFDIETLTWHYSEKGHGKGAPDGIGGCIKRICDNSVARGNDVADLQALMSCLDENCKGIETFPIDEEIVTQVKQIADSSIKRPFKGTLDIHQLTWSKKEPNILHARRLSCLVCAAHRICPHYEMGQIQIQSKMPNSPKSPESPDIDIDAFFEVPEFLNIPDESPRRSHNTSSASTEPNSPGFSGRITPDVLTETRNTRPAKHLGLLFNSDTDSDSSPGRSIYTLRNRKRSAATINSHESDSIVNEDLPKKARRKTFIFDTDTDSDS